MLTKQQKRGVQLTVLAVVSLLIVFVVLFVFRITTPRVMLPSELKANGAFLFDNPRQLSPFELVDYNQKPFTVENLQGKWSLIFFGFTFCPDICPTSLALLNRFYKQQLEGKFGEDTQIILVTVDPARDTPDKLKTYVQFFNEDFLGVTGEFLDIKRFATELNTPFNKIPGGGENYLMDHGSNVVLLNDKGHYVGFFRAPLELAKLNATYRSIRATN